MDLNKMYAEMAENLGMNPPEESKPVRKPIAYNSSNPKRLAFRNKAVQESTVYQEACAKRLLLDIYMKVLPMDKDYVDCNQDQCAGDIDKFLASKGMTAMQYFNSAADATGAPMMESIVDNLKAFGKGFVEKAMEDADEAAEGGTEIEAPETKEEDIDEQIVDVTNDMEYENFVDALKKKTIDKIVNDISALIVDNKENSDMVFDPKEKAEEEPVEDEGSDEALQESALAVTLDYVSESCAKAGVEMPEDQDEVMGMAVREATLNMIDRTFEQPGSDIKQFASRMRFGKGAIVTESVVINLTHNDSDIEKYIADQFKKLIPAYEKIEAIISVDKQAFSMEFWATINGKRMQSFDMMESGAFTEKAYDEVSKAIAATLRLTAKMGGFGENIAKYNVTITPNNVALTPVAN